jgi:hypothetical protein
MSRASVLARGRAAAARGFVDSCLIQAVASLTTNPDTGQVTRAYTTVYSGPCRIQQRAEARSRREDAGEASLLMSQRELQLPVATSTGVRAGQRVTVTASVNDPDLVGKVFVVRDEAAKSEATARRVGIEEETS